MIGIGCWSTDNERKITHVNKAACDMLEHEDSDIVGNVTVDYVGEEHYNKTIQAVRSALGGKDIPLDQIHVKNMQDKQLVVDANIFPKSDGYGTVTGIYVLARRDRERPILSLLDKVGVACFVTNLKGGVEDANESACNMLLYSPDEVIGKNAATALITAECKDDFKQALVIASEDKFSDLLSLDLLPKRGDKLHMTALMGPRRSKDRNIDGAMVIAMPDSGSELLNLLNKIGIGGWFTGSEGSIDSCNQVACDISEFTKQEQMGEPLSSKLIVHSNSQEISTGLDISLDGEEMLNKEVELMTKHKNNVPVTTFILPRRDICSRIVGSMLIAVVDKGSELLDKLGLGVILTDMDGKIEKCNKKALVMAQYSENEMMGLPFAEKFTAETSDVKLAVSRATVKGGDTFDLAFHLKQKTGFELPMSSQILTRRNGGDIIGSMIILALGPELMRVLDRSPTRISTLIYEPEPSSN